MIFENILGFFGDIFMNLIKLFNIPGLPDDVLESAYDFLDLLFSNASLLGLFIRIRTIKTTAVLLLLILNFEHIYNFAKWCINKIPFVNNT